MRELYLVSPLLVFILSGLLTGLFLRGHARSPLHRVFALMLLMMALWGLTIFGMRISASVDSAIAWERAVLVAVIGVPLFFYHFTRLFVQQRSGDWLLPVSYAMALAMATLAAMGLVVDRMEEEWYGYAPRFGPLFAGYLFLVYSLTVLGAWNLVKYYRSSPSDQARRRTIYILLGVGCSVLGGIFDSLPQLMGVYPIGMLGNLFFALFTAIAILKHNLLDVRIVIKRGFVYSVVTGFILGVYVALLSSLNVLFESRGSGISWSANLAAVLIAAMMLKPVLDRVQSLADRWFSRIRYDSLSALETFSRETKDITDLRQLATVLENAVTLAMGAESARLLMPFPQKGFVPVCGKNSEGSQTFKLRSSSPIAAWLRSHDDVLQREDLQTEPQFLPLSASDWAKIEQFGVQLLVPLKCRSELVGILVMGTKQSEQAYTGEDLGLLRSAANQTALALETARLFASVVSQRTRLEHLFERSVRAQEDERKRLSMELHDSPVQWLTSAVFKVQAGLKFFRRGQHEKAYGILEELQEILDTTLTELRHSTAALHPPELEKVGLFKALQRYVAAFEGDTSIRCRISQSGSVPRLTAPEELAAYRVIQEALSNVRKHARASEVEIRLGMRGGNLRATVKDNGIGFDMDDIRRTEDRHLGLAGMEERARMLGGRLTIHSTPGTGTLITLLIPVRLTNETLDTKADVVAGAGGRVHHASEVAA